MNLAARIQYWLAYGVRYLLTGRKGLTEKEFQRKAAYAKWVARALLRNIFIERKNTYCPKLWDSVYIDQFGAVFTCCHSQPMAFGNLYKTNLRTIWQKNLWLRVFRWLARHKALYCALGCTLLSQAEKDNVPHKSPALPHPTVARICHGELCNLACVMCWQNHKDKRMISNAVLQQGLDWEHVTDIELFGGEILAMKEAKAFFTWVTQEQGKKANLITNGVLINDEWARNLVLGSDWVAISVNAATQAVHEKINVGSRFPRVLDNIRRLVRFKRELNSPITIIYKFTITVDNVHEIAAAIPVAAELGVDKITYGYEETVPAYLRAHPDLKVDLQRQLEAQLAAGLPIEIERVRLEYLGVLPPLGELGAACGAAALQPPA
jgi:MoaA/NifB/PqqE/SkfB family radical SAM enzyme